jgi:hypothetical protein
VLNCAEQLVQTYCLKKKACTEHMQALQVRLAAGDPVLYRFCQQCGKFEDVSKFGENFSSGRYFPFQNRR